MSTSAYPALGAYLRRLRKHRGLKAKDVLAQLAQRLGVSSVAQSRLWRAEKGVAWPEGDFLAALLDILGARASDIGWIQLHPTDEVKAQQLADEVLPAEQWLLIFTKGTPARTTLLRELAQLTDDPALRQRLEDFAAGLKGGIEAPDA